MPESRTGKRFPLSLPITVHDKESHQHAITSNVSGAGVYIWSPTDLALGSKVEFEITLPAKVIGAEHDVRVCCRGRVVRNDGPAGIAGAKVAAKSKSPKAKAKPAVKKSRSKSHKHGIACVIDHYKFVAVA